MHLKSGLQNFPPPHLELDQGFLGFQAGKKLSIKYLHLHKTLQFRMFFMHKSYVSSCIFYVVPLIRYKAYIAKMYAQMFALFILPIH